MNVELMLKVRERVLAEPEMVSMDNYFHDFYAPDFYFMWQGKRECANEACKTVCCIAGHAILQSGKSKSDVFNYEHETATDVLGLDKRESDLLFFFHEACEDSEESDANPYFGLSRKLVEYSEGTPEYAAVVAEAIDLCIARNSRVDLPPEKTAQEVEILEPVEV